MVRLVSTDSKLLIEPKASVLLLWLPALPWAMIKYEENELLNYAVTVRPKDLIGHQ